MLSREDSRTLANSILGIIPLPQGSGYSFGRYYQFWLTFTLFVGICSINLPSFFLGTKLTSFHSSSSHASALVSRIYHYSYHFSTFGCSTYCLRPLLSLFIHLAYSWLLTAGPWPPACFACYDGRTRCYWFSCIGFHQVSTLNTCT